MATNKNQHFVPRCYLRPFTLNDEDAAINVYNLDRKKIIPLAPVKNQCSGDYFYGKDDLLEKAIQSIESEYGKTIRQLLSSCKTLSPHHKVVLRTFWLFQYIRTEAAARRAVEMNISTTKVAGIPAEEFRLNVKDAVQMAMHNFAKTMHEIDDLKFCIIKNKTDIPFITSDDPAIITNRWHFEDSRAIGRSFGYGSAGVLAILPLSPRLLCLGYDGDVYSVPNVNGVTHTKGVRDIVAYNQFQYINCRANIFFKDAAHADMVHTNYEDVEAYRPKERHVLYYAEKDVETGEYARYTVINPKERSGDKEAIIHSQVLHPRPNIWPAQIRLRHNGSVFSNGTAMGHVRHSRAVRHIGRPFFKERA